MTVLRPAASRRSRPLRARRSSFRVRPPRAGVARVPGGPARPLLARLRVGPARPLLARSVVLAVVAAVALAGCGDGGGGGDGASGTTATDTDAAGNGAPEGGPADPVTVEDLVESSGGAPAVGDVDLPAPPGDARRTGLPGVGETAASITAADGTVTGCCLLVAAAAEQRQRGLMEVTDLGGYDGMVFVWDTDVESGFWMRNTPTPLSIAWFDADGEFVSTTDMEPCPDTDGCPTYPPAGPYRFAVEVFQGDLDALGVGPGSRLTLGGACAAAAG